MLPVLISSGQLVIEDCTISSATRTGNQYRRERDKSTNSPVYLPWRRKNGDLCGRGKGTFEECHISNHKMQSVCIHGGDPLFHQCTIRAGEHLGIWVKENGKGPFANVN